MLHIGVKAMSDSFYRFLMTQRNPNDHGEVATFAQNAFLDHGFPKQSTDYHELADYLELNGSYLPNMDVFDEAFRLYQEQGTGESQF
jgi:uncharacterized protein YozE (UPF0346 family)